MLNRNDRHWTRWLVLVFGIAAWVCLIALCSGCTTQADQHLKEYYEGKEMVEAPQYAYGVSGYLGCIQRAKRSMTPIAEAEKYCDRAYFKR